MILSKPYNRERAITYAETWALRRNPLFLNFAGRGGDCTNFTSQCLLAGSCTMDFTPDFGWYYRNVNDRAPSWTSVAFFYDFLTGNPVFASENAGIGPYGREVRAREIEPGDFIQLADEMGDYYHTLIITGFEPNDILICAHTDDSLNRRLSTYNYASLRFIHIDGVRMEVPDDVCYEPLLDGIAIEVNDQDADVSPLPIQPGEMTPDVLDERPILPPMDSPAEPPESSAPPTLL